MEQTWRILSPVEWDGVRYEIDDTVEMPDSVARQLVDVGAITPEHPARPSTGQGPDMSSGRDGPESPGRSGEDAPKARAGSEDPPNGPGPGGGEAGPGDQGEARHAELVAAIRKLDRSDASLWAGRGTSRKPKVAALRAALGRDCSAAERDAAWASVRTGD